MIPNGPGACLPISFCPTISRPFPQLLPYALGAGRTLFAGADYHKPTVCTEVDVTRLAGHLIGPVTFLGAAAGSGAGAAPGPGPLETRSAVSIH